MTKEEIRHFKPIINSMKLIQEYCADQETCVNCVFDGRGGYNCPLDVPAAWDCEEAIATLEAEEDNDGNV